MSGLDCDSCESKLHLAYCEKILTLSSGEKIAVEHTPFLVCDVCQKIYISPLAKELLDELKKLVESAEQEEEKNTIEVNQEQGDTSSESIKQWYDFNKIKREICCDKYIAEKVKFIYDKDDYYFIPGLIRPWKIGFLTPVFFNIEVLLKYIHHPLYGLDIGADTFGYIYKGDEHYLSFGINENNKVIMWLGDIVELNVEEQFYLRSENITSDHCIGSEFYEAQIENVWAKASAERRLLKKRLDFNEKVREYYNIAVAQLDTETLTVAKNIRKLLINTNDAFKDLIIPLNELFVEAINNKAISKNLKEKYPELREELKNKKGIKLLQLWLEKNTDKIDVNKEIAPLFVLYDLRLVSAHLYSEDSREELLASCCTRLGLEESEQNYITIANTLIKKLDEMYDMFIKHLCWKNAEEEDENGK